MVPFTKGKPYTFLLPCMHLLELEYFSICVILGTDKLFIATTEMSICGIS